MPITTHNFLDDYLKAGDKCSVLGAESVNRSEVALVIKEPPHIAARLAADRLFRGDGGQFGCGELLRLAVRDGGGDHSI